MDSPLRAVATNEALSACKTLLVGADGPTQGELSLENILCALEQSNFAGELNTTFRLDNVVAECEVFRPELVMSLGAKATNFILKSKERLKETHGKVS